MTEPTVSIDTIKRMCAAAFEVTVNDLVSHRRDKRSIVARHGAMWMARHLTTLSLPQIGRHFGARDHSTIRNAIARMDDRIAASTDEGETVVHLFMQLKLPDVLAKPAGAREAA